MSGLAGTDVAGNCVTITGSDGLGPMGEIGENVIFPFYLAHRGDRLDLRTCSGLGVKSVVCETNIVTMFQICGCWCRSAV